METVRQALLITHIVAGFIALAASVVPIASRKGGDAHRRYGRVFSYCMAVVAITSVALFAFGASAFLSFVAVFSGYLVFTGVRAAQLKRDPAATIDRLANMTGWVGVIGLLVVAWVYNGAAPTDGESDKNAIATVALVFAGILGIFTAYDLFRFFRPAAEKMDWWFRHLTRMSAGVIASVTAFSVVNIEFLPELVRWLWPTVVGTAAVTYSNIHYRRKFGIIGGGIAVGTEP